jgi:DNA-binding response OmpR family regulator
MRSELEGQRILLIEDEFVVAAMLEEALQEAGCEVVGPVPRVRQALQIAADEAFDIALLDVNLSGELVFPVAKVLAKREVPFVFMTGYNRNVLPPEYADRPSIGKPFKLVRLLNLLAVALMQPAAR